MVNWEKVFEGAGWFHWTGITPAISQGAADACLEAIQVANRMGVTVSTDLNYRKKLWKYGKDPMDVMPALVEGCDIILGNEEDALLRDYYPIPRKHSPRTKLLPLHDFSNPTQLAQARSVDLLSVSKRLLRTGQIVNWPRD